MNNVMNAVLDKEIGKLLEYRQLIRGLDKNIWIVTLANDIG